MMDSLSVVTSPLEQQKKRKAHLDFLKIVAIFFVLLNHSPGFFLYESATGIKQWVYLFISVCTKMNVPLFFMVSGALLLTRNETYKTVLQKRFSKYVIILFTFSFCLFLLVPLMEEGVNNLTMDLPTFLLNWLNGSAPHTWSYWYLYAYLGMLLMLPFMQKMAQNATDNDFKALFYIHFFLATVLPSLSVFLSATNSGPLELSPHFSVPLATLKNMFFPFLGYYLENRIDINKVTNRKMFAFSICTFAGILFSCFISYFQGFSYHITQDYFVIFDYLTASFVFIFTKWLFLKVKTKHPTEKSGRIISFCGALTFGIYLLEPFLKGFFEIPFF
ncbi:acyltransferase [Ruminococcaceae bacterium OttesenSCG-928-N02]|nr:acyltransferase [Ruminococcaceae bacterium OttesenSCG-928-N02]